MSRRRWLPGPQVYLPGIHRNGQVDTTDQGRMRSSRTWRRPHLASPTSLGGSDPLGTLTSMVGSRGLSVDETAGQRWELALDLLRQGETVIFRGVDLTLRQRVLVVLAQITWRTRPSAALAREDIARAECVVGGLLDESPEFRALVGQRSIEYHAVDDPGMGPVSLGELVDGMFTWRGMPTGRGDRPARSDRPAPRTRVY